MKFQAVQRRRSCSPIMELGLRTDKTVLLASCAKMSFIRTLTICSIALMLNSSSEGIPTFHFVREHRVHALGPVGRGLKFRGTIPLSFM